TVTVAELRQQGDRRLVGVERAGLVAHPRLRQADAVERQRPATPVPEPREELERLLADLQSLLEGSLLAQAGCLLVQSHRLALAPGVGEVTPYHLRPRLHGSHGPTAGRG